MAYNELLAERVRTFFIEKGIVFEEKKMFGGWCVMVDDKMCIGVIFHKKGQVDALMCRVDPLLMDNLLENPACLTMDFTGKAMRGFIFVIEDGYKSQKDLYQWCQLCLDYNPIAKKSAKKK